MSDLARLACNSPIPIIYHFKEKENKHIYFCYVMTHGVTVIHYVEIEKELGKKYVAYNSFDGKVIYTDRISTDARFRYIPIIEVEEQNIF